MYTQCQSDGYIQGLHRAGTVAAHTQKHTDGYIKGPHRAGTVYAHRCKLTDTYRVCTGQGQFMHTGTN